MDLGPVMEDGVDVGRESVPPVGREAESRLGEAPGHRYHATDLPGRVQAVAAQVGADTVPRLGVSARTGQADDRRVRLPQKFVEEERPEEAGRPREQNRPRL